MSHENIQAAVYKRFNDEFNGFPFVLENQKWPSTSEQPTNAPWCRLCVRFSDSRNTTVDGKYRRIAGMVWLQIFVQPDAGAMPARIMADKVETIFANKTIVRGGEVLRFERAQSAYVGKVDSWEQHRCTVEFLSDAITP